MKKYWKVLLCAAIGIGTFTACEDVPEPYNIPTESGQQETPTPTGIEVTCAEAVEKTNALADGATSTETYTITGYITEVVGDVSKDQQTFWMADTKDGGRVFEAFYANLPEGISAFKAGSKVKITGKLTKYVNNNTGKVTPEIKNATVEIVEDDGDTPTPTGTEVTCAEAVELTNALADGATSTDTYTITGYITEVVSDVSKNQQTFWMADTKDGGRVFEAYWANLPEGVSAFKVGSKVKITGKLMKYVNNNTGQVTPEIKNATVVILENGDDTPTPQPSGTEVTCAQAVELTNALTDGATSEETYTVTGYITEVIGSVSTKTGTPQQSFWMADTKDGGQVFEAYYANLPSGISEFKAGSKVKITGKFTKYVNNNTGQVTPEIKNATVEILESGDGDTPTPTPSGDQIMPTRSGDQIVIFNDINATGIQIVNDFTSNSKGTQLRIANFVVTFEDETEETAVMADLGLENAAELTTHTLGSFTLAFAQNGGSNAPKYYTAVGGAARMYALNSLTITANKVISKLVINCTEPSSGTLYNGNEQLYGVALK